MIYSLINMSDQKIGFRTASWDDDIGYLKFFDLCLQIKNNFFLILFSVVEELKAKC